MPLNIDFYENKIEFCEIMYLKNLRKPEITKKKLKEVESSKSIGQIYKIEVS